MGCVDELAPDSDLIDLLRLWRVDPRAHTEELAERFPDDVTGEESFSELGRTVTELEERLRVTPLEGTEAQDAAVAAMCRRLAAGHLTPREVTYWVTHVVGWRGSPRTQPLLALEQDYCAAPLSDEEVAELDEQVRSAARDFLAGPATEVRPKQSRVRRLLRRTGPGAPRR